MLEFKVFNIANDTRPLRGRLPLTPGSTLSWLGFSEEGQLSCYDSKISMHKPLKRNQVAKKQKRNQVAKKQKRKQAVRVDSSLSGKGKVFDDGVNASKLPEQDEATPHKANDTGDTDKMDDHAYIEIDVPERMHTSRLDA